MFIMRMTAIPANIDDLDDAFASIKELAEHAIRKYYLTKCKKCSSFSQVVCRIFETGKALPTEIRYECSEHGRMSKKPDDSDIKNENEVRNAKIPYWYPQTRLQYSNGTAFLKSEKWKTIADVFTKRNLICLSILKNAIDKIENEEARDLLQFTFTSMVHLASRMTLVRESRPFSSSWGRPSFWVPPIHMESNVWSLYEGAYIGKQGIRRGKEHSNQEMKKWKEARDFQGLSDATVLLLNQSALDLSNIPSESVDYVFTDPPYGGSIQYMELSTLWGSWLGLDSRYNYEDEITVNDSQKKDFEYYHKMLRAAFDEIFRVLKDEKYLTVTFHSTDIKVWNSIIRAVAFSGFELEKIIYQPPLRASDKALGQPYGSAIGDYYIRFRKPKGRATAQSQEFNESKYDRVVIETAKNIIARRGEPTPYTHILNGVIPELEKNGLFFASAKRGIETVLKEQVGKEFQLIESTLLGQSGRLWWFKDPSTIPYLEHVPLTERIEKVVINVLNQKIVASFDDVLQEVFISFPNSLTPDTESIREILKSYALPTKDGRWRLKPNFRTREKQHDDVVEILCILGERAGFTVYGDTRSRRTSLNLAIPKNNLDRVREIDVLWYSHGVIDYSFEVENTTGISEPFIRGSNIPYRNKRFIVIPDEREGLLSRKVEEPALKERIQSDGWNFIKYDDLFGFYEKVKNHSRIKVSRFLILRPSLRPRNTRRTQQWINTQLNNSFRIGLFNLGHYIILVITVVRMTSVRQVCMTSGRMLSLFY